jgi:hypothetical protein
MMNKRIIPVLAFFFALSALYGQSSENPAFPLDGAVKSLAAEIQKAIPAGETEKIALGQWSCRDSVPTLGIYWAAQLTEELTNIPGRSFILVSDGPGGSDWTVAGEIVEVPGAVRVYTRLLRSVDHAIAASFHADFEMNDYLAGMLATGGRGTSSSVIRDNYENDNDVDSAKDISIGTPQQHTFTTGDDTDWVKFRISQAGSYTIRTRGVNSADLDTYIELYDGNHNSVDDDDDGGEGLDSRLSVRLQAGTYYLKVECLDSEPDQAYTIRIDAENR